MTATVNEKRKTIWEKTMKASIYDATLKALNEHDLSFTLKRVHAAETRLRDLPRLRRVLSTIGKVEGATGQSSESVYRHL